MIQNAFVIEADAPEGVRRVHAWVTEELGISVEKNPDVMLLQYGLLSIDEVRRIFEHATSAPLRGDAKVLIITADRAYHEAQNALLKLFEEPPQGTHLFLIIPNLGALLPTLLSRVQILHVDTKPVNGVSEVVRTFIQASQEERQTFIKKLTSGKDDVSRNANRETALELVNGVESLVYGSPHEGKQALERATLLVELTTLRGYLNERSAPIRLALEHLALVLPKDLV